MKKLLHSALLLISGLIVLNPAALGQKYFTAEESVAVKLGRTKPLSEVMVMAPTDGAKLKELKSNKPKFVPNFRGRRHLESHNPEALPKGADPLYNPSSLRHPLTEVLPKVSIEGINENQANSSVSDVNGDIGKDFYVEIVNATRFRVYDKSGIPVSNIISANTIWNQVGQSSAGDPILLYDQEADRWFLTEFPSGNRVLIAISVTNDPRGAWDAWTFSTPRFPDFPKYGIWPDAFYLTTNEGGSSFPIYAFNREDILAGADIVRFQRLTVPKINGVFFEVGQPIDWDGMTPPPAGSPGLVVKLNDDDWGNTDHDHILLHKINIDWDNSINSNIEVIDIPSAPFDTDGCSFEHTGGFSCVPQPNGQGIDGAQWIITNKAMYRNFGSHESFVMSFMVDVTGDDVAGIRWMEFRKTPLQDWHIYQEGTVGSDDGLHRFMSSIGIDGQGNIGLAYSVSGLEKHPSLRYTGRYSTDPAGEMTIQEFEFGTGGGSLGFDRFGDYASMSVDPADDLTFWFAGQYVPEDGNWSTRIVSFSAARDTIDILPVSVLHPKSSAELNNGEILSVTILNRGLEDVVDFDISYQFQEQQWFAEDATQDTLKIDSVYTHIFSQPLNFDAPGNYVLKIATDLAQDRNRRNDTITYIITRHAFKDIALQYDVPGNPTTICANENESHVILRNLGVDTVRSLSLELYQNGELTDTIFWTGELAFNDEESFSILLPNLQEGLNQFNLKVLTINDEQDEIPSNDEIAWEITAKPDGIPVFLNLLTDNFPQETTWELADLNHQLIASGGPYSAQQSLEVSPFCLDPGVCYNFILYDAFGDGISGQGVEGDFEIVNMEGEVLTSLADPDFGEISNNQFCLNGQCLLELSVGVQHESAPGAGDGLAFGEAINSQGSIQYSLDGFNYQDENTFDNLSAGQYVLYAQDEAGCQDTASFTIVSCLLQTVITTLPASGGDVGQIHIDATGGAEPVMYSLNGGAFTMDSFFIMLEPGDYLVTTRDDLGCEVTDSVTVSTEVGTKHISDDAFIRILPNPGNGLYQVAAEFSTLIPQIAYTIYTPDGEPVNRGRINRYNDVYKGEISLLAHPAGTYIIVFQVDQKLAVRRIIKID